MNLVTNVGGLLTGEAIPLVSDTYKSADFIELLKILYKKYPSQDKIRNILDNHFAHTSKETKNFLATVREGRFEFVFTPKHGSWLNMIESFFSKMTKQMLKGIRVKSKELQKKTQVRCKWNVPCQQCLSIHSHFQ